MGFGFNYDTQSNGDIIPVVKYDARAGRLFRVDRADRINTPVDITRSFKAVVDLENVEVGYMNFATGGAPDFVMTKLGNPLPQRPTNDHKQGVRIMMKLGKDCGGDIRELATVAKVGLKGLDDLHTAYEGARERQAGQLPIVVLKDTLAVTSEGQGQKSTNYQPVFEIVGWADRPKDLVFKPKSRSATPSVAAPAPATQASATPPATGSTQVSAPAAAPAPAPAPQVAPAMSEDDDFG